MSLTPTHYRVDELARLAGTTARNIRAYRERGLLAPPHLTGRTGWYDDSHLARLRLLTRLLERGYTLGNIAELLAAWESGRPVGEVLGLEQVLTRPLAGDEPVVVTVAELAALIGVDESTLPLGALCALGLVEVDGERCLLPHPTLVRIGGDLVAAGMPVQVVLELARHLIELLDQVAQHFVQTASETLFAPEEPPAAVEDIDRRATELLVLAQEAVTHTLAWSLERQLAAELGRSVTRRTTREAVLA
ncbi:MAG: MerR family transcriptional regulator [Actinomycetes bacterium]